MKTWRFIFSLLFLTAVAVVIWLVYAEVTSLDCGYCMPHGLLCGVLMLIGFGILATPYLFTAFFTFVIIRFFYRRSVRKQAENLLTIRQKTQLFSKQAQIKSQANIDQKIQLYSERKQALENYYRYARQQGLSRAEVMSQLLHRGKWSQEEIKSVLNRLP
jgi:predicted membrane protein